ncbi:MAG: hypothetical protein FIA92_00370 [Chloroflexi bacterium]|nr:hypothetical protein [Chloroflexota bacterium]
MHAIAARLLITFAALSLAACSTGGPPPSASPSPSPGADDAPPVASALLRVTQFQALPPRETFGWTPSIVVTLDGRVLTGGAVPAIYPGPLMAPILERQLTPAGWAAIVAEARAAGLLSGAQDFTDGGVPPGGVTARLELVADGRLYDLTGDPSRVMMCITTPCVPPAGTPEAFAGFLVRLADLGSWLPGELGPERVHVPAGFGILVGDPPEVEPGLGGPPATWPLAGGFAALGKPLADGSGDRCGTISGADAAAVWPLIQAATQITRWSDPVDGTAHGITVRPLLPGDGDPCAAIAAA